MTVLQKVEKKNQNISRQQVVDKTSNGCIYFFRNVKLSLEEKLFAVAARYGKMGYFYFKRFSLQNKLTFSTSGGHEQW